MRDLLATGANAGLWARIKSRIIAEVTSQVSAAFAGVSSVPIGTVSPFAGASAPANWLFCDGSAVSRTTYADLFTTIGTTYGSGNGSTTFNVPDLRGRVVIAQDDMGTGSAGRVSAATTLNYSTGSATHTLSVSEMPSHNHGGSATTSSSGSHSHTSSNGLNFLTTSSFSYLEDRDLPASGSYDVLFDFANAGSYQSWPTTNSTGSHTHTVTISSQGSGGSHNNLQPLLTLNYIIRA